MNMHKSITTERVAAAVEEGDYVGLCIECGAEAGGCEPDARQYKCECCGEKAVYGAEELLIRLVA